MQAQAQVESEVAKRPPRKVQLVVADITVHYRTVRIPKKCPHCKARLVVVGVRAAEYMDVTYDGGIDPDGKYEVGENGFEWYGDDMITGVAYYCGDCMGTIASGKFVNAPQREAEESTPCDNPDCIHCVPREQRERNLGLKED